MSEKITVAEFERKVWERERIRIVIRASQTDMVDDYEYMKCCSASFSVTDWVNKRVIEKLDGKDFYIVDGTGTRPHGRTRLDNVRESYK